MKIFFLFAVNITHNKHGTLLVIIYVLEKNTLNNDGIFFFQNQIRDVYP